MKCSDSHFKKTLHGLGEIWCSQTNAFHEHSPFWYLEIRSGMMQSKLRRCLTSVCKSAPDLAWK